MRSSSASWLLQRGWRWRRPTAAGPHCSNKAGTTFAAWAHDNTTWTPLSPSAKLTTRAKMSTSSASTSSSSSSSRAPLLGELHQQLSFAETFSTSSRIRRVEDATGGVGGGIPEEDELGDASPVTSSEAIRAADRALDLQERTAVSVLTVERAVKEACDAYERLDGDTERGKYLRALSTRSVDAAEVARLATQYSDAAFSSTASPARLEEELREALNPRYDWLFRRVGQLPGGVKFLTDLRADVIRTQKEATSKAATSSSPSSVMLKSAASREALAELRLMNSRLRQLLANWFSVGFLELDQVTWDSPCAMLQKVSDYEAVHPMRNWLDLKARVGAYRRCFVYTHRSMPGEPIVVLHVALEREVPASISSVVRHHRMVKRFSVESSQAGWSNAGGAREARAGEDASLCKAAVFYSITSTQRGLSGIDLGTYIIKQAVRKLREELPGLQHFSSLSPIPGFRSWLISTIQSIRRGDDEGRRLFSDAEVEKLSARLGCDKAEFLEKFEVCVRSNSWKDDEDLTRDLETPLMRLCAWYLYREKHRRWALDPVANFHVRNGAVVWRINWRGDLSARGLANSCGIMVNYKYFLDELEENSSAYQEGQAIKAGEQVSHLVAAAENVNSA